MSGDVHGRRRPAGGSPKPRRVIRLAFVLALAGCAPGFVDRLERVPGPEACANLDGEAGHACRACFADGGWYEWQKGGYLKAPSWACKQLYYYPHDCGYAASEPLRARCEACLGRPRPAGTWRRFAAPDRCEEKVDVP